MWHYTSVLRNERPSSHPNSHGTEFLGRCFTSDIESHCRVNAESMRGQELGIHILDVHILCWYGKFETDVAKPYQNRNKLSYNSIPV